MVHMAVPRTTHGSPSRSHADSLRGQGQVADPAAACGRLLTAANPRGLTFRCPSDIRSFSERRPRSQEVTRAPGKTVPFVGSVGLALGRGRATSKDFHSAGWCDVADSSCFHHERRNESTHMWIHTAPRDHVGCG